MKTLVQIKIDSINKHIERTKTRRSEERTGFWRNTYTVRLEYYAQITVTEGLALARNMLIWI